MSKTDKRKAALYLLLSLICWILFLLCLNKVLHAAELDLGVNYLSGQHQTRNLNLGLQVPLLDDTALFSSKVAYGSHNNEIVQNRGHLRLNYDPTINEKWSLWFYEEVGYDKPQEIELESFTGGGPKYILYETDRSKSSVSLGYLYHYQEDRPVSRLSLRLKAKGRLDTLDVSAVCFYEPNIGDFDDYILIGEVGISFSLVKGGLALSILKRPVARFRDIRLKWTIEDNYRSVSLVEKNEFLTRLSLGVTF